jgi:transketolase
MRRREQATVVAVGPALACTLPALEGLDVTLLYCTTVAPFDEETLRIVHRGQKVVLVEPYYEGVLAQDIYHALHGIPVELTAIGVACAIPTHYGTLEQHNAANGLTPQDVRRRIEAFL